MVKEFMVDVLVSVLHKMGIEAHKWFFDPAKWAARREKDRQRWWRYVKRTQATEKDKLDDARAECLGVYFKFRTPPGQQSGEYKARRAALRAAACVANRDYAGAEIELRDTIQTLTALMGEDA